MHCSTSSFPVHHQLPELTQTHVHWLGDAISSVVPVSSRLQSFSASGSFQMSQFFASSGQNIGFSFSISPSNEYSGQISFRMDCLDLLALQGTLMSLHQHYSSKTSVLQCSAFLQSNSHIHTWLLEKPQLWLDGPSLAKSLLFNVLFRLVITFPPRSKHLFTSWLQSPSAVILEPKKIESATVSIVSPPTCYEVMGPDAMIFIFWMLSFKPTFFTLLFHFHQEAL